MNEEWQCPISERAGAQPINLALQGGGAHGAFTWGVLDRLMEDERVVIEGISGTSAGAMNAVVVADGIMEDGLSRAREALRDFWKAISNAACASPIQRTWLDMLTGNWNLDNSPGYLFLDILQRMASPYELNILNLNPLRDLLASSINFDRVRSCNLLKVFVSATSVRTGKVKVFERTELTPDAVMASAALPYIFQAVEIDDEAYWDGGYAGNPVLFPFAYKCTCRDVVIVQINPLKCQETPQSAQEIINRTNEITSNSSLLAELRAIDFVARMLDEHRLDPIRYKRMLIHVIEAESEFKPLNASSKMNGEWEFLLHLFNIGRKAAADWLDQNFDSIGKASTVDLRSLIS